MKKIALTYNQKRFAYSIVTSVLSLSVLLLSILGLKYSADDAGTISPDLNLWMFGTYLALSLSRLPLVFRAKFVEKKRLPFFRNIALASLMPFWPSFISFSQSKQPSMAHWPRFIS
jgi:hypothetical protein